VASRTNFNITLNNGNASNIIRQIASHERPSLKIYQKDGTGRDSYISANNGGFAVYPTPLVNVVSGTGY
jgi:hypothetical protein